MIAACPAAADLRALLDERLAGEYETALLAHVEQCSDCQDALERLTAVDLPSVARLAKAGPVALPNPTPPPARLGPFRLDRELGRGGMGVVYLAHHVRLRRPAAVKVIRAGAAATAELVARFRTEAEALAAVRHPNVVQVFETGEHEHSAWIALEYVPGGTLRDRLGGKPIPFREAARLMAGVARGAAAAHERGIVHRDLKPANILLSPQSTVPSPPSQDTGLGTGDSGLGTPKVTDFGLAKLSDSNDRLTQTGAALGTPHYMPPEQARGQSTGPAADVYAIGAVLYECLTGRPPFEAVDQLALMNQVMCQTPVPVRRLQPSVPRDLETVCLKCLEKEPGKRYPSAAALADDLDRVLAGRPTAARPVSWAGHLARWSRRNPYLAGLAAALVIAVAAGGVGVTLKWREAVAERRRAEEERQRAEEEEDRVKEAKKAVEAQVVQLTEAHVKLNRIVFAAAFRLKSGSPDDALRDLAGGLDEMAEAIAKAEVADPRLRYSVRATAASAYRVLGQDAPAIRHASAALADAEASDGPNSKPAVAALIELAGLHERRGETAAGAEYRRRGLAALDALSASAGDAVDDYVGLSAYWREWVGEAELAVRVMERAVAVVRAQPAGHPRLVAVLHEAAWAHLRAGRPAEAVAYEREAALALEAQVGPRHKECAGLSRDAETLMAEAGRTDPDLFDFVVRSFGSDPPGPRLLALRGHELLGRREWAAAEPILRECLRLRLAAEPTVWTTFNAQAMLGASLLGQGKHAEAEPLLLDGFRGMKAREAGIPAGGRRRLPEAAKRLMQLYAETGRPDEAARWSKEATPIESGPVPRELGPG